MLLHRHMHGINIVRLATGWKAPQVSVIVHDNHVYSGIRRRRRPRCPNPNATPSRTQPLTSSSRLIRSIGSSASAKTSSFDPRNNAHSPDAAHASPQSGGKGTGKGIRNKQSNGREFMLRVHAEGTCREMLVEDACREVHVCVGHVLYFH